jgi:hypothetical protein
MSLPNSLTNSQLLAIGDINRDGVVNHYDLQDSTYGWPVELHQTGLNFTVYSSTGVLGTVTTLLLPQIYHSQR